MCTQITTNEEIDPDFRTGSKCENLFPNFHSDFHID